MINYKEFFQAEVLKAVHELGFAAEDALISQSNRPDLSDYQSNIALPLAKKNGLVPRELASKLAEKLSANDGLYTVSVDGPGFINFSLTNRMLEDNSEPFSFKPSGRTIVIDYGGPNIAKALHVGHLRAAVIGESMKRIMRESGDKVIGDVHFGDWGTPIGMLISQLQNDGLDASKTMTIAEISDLYKRAAASFKESDDFKEQARVATSELQAGNEEYRKIWQMFHDVSIADIKKIYDALDVDFDLWLGESDVNDILPTMFAELTAKGMAVESDGAVIIPLPPIKGRERAPFILRKTDGAYTYAATDLATIIQRMKDFNPDAILYVVDARQKEHFEQVFEVARTAGYVPENVSLEHLGFGTVNGADGKPFKTRDGGVMSLMDLLVLAENKAKEALPEPSADISKEELDLQAAQIAFGGIKYQDLKNNRISDYIFDTENFTKSEGKTGAYVQYAIVRINSILAKAKENGFAIAPKVEISHTLEREIMLTLERYPEVIIRAYETREPSEISEYAHILSQKFSSFYAELSVLGEQDEKVRASRLKIAELTRDTLHKSLWLLGISAPDKMLRKE
ncbi:MAG: arginine--tRNA ligase [Alphaproteobacteria bacterium]|nr:arginine--tRNA ligase [Alphaproteobacteria bacterium]